MPVRQRVSCDELSYEAEGRFLAAPGSRRRLEMHVRVGNSHGQVRAVSDGRRVWVRSQVEDEEPQVVREDLPAGPQAAELLHRHGLESAALLLGAIRQRLQHPRQETTIWGRRRVVRIAGDWPADAPHLASLPDDLQACAVPKHCRVFLDEQTLALVRVEWWSDDRLLAETEFGTPVVNRELSAEQCAREFAVE
jgi:hypothetical protein